MDYSTISQVASRYTNSIGPFSFIISGGGVSFNYYIPDLIPLILLHGMYWVLLVSILGMIIIQFKDSQMPHAVIGEKCIKCQRPLLYTGVKCSNDKCDYEVKL